jgi:hypothetical protein
VLGGYRYFATIYQRSPPSLPVLSDLAKMKLSNAEKLHELASQAATEHPLSVFLHRGNADLCAFTIQTKQDKLAP